MKRSVRKMVEEFRLYWKHYVLQSLFATLAVFIVLYFLSLQDAVIIASLGATAFIVFAMPGNLTAQPRNVIGGHLVGLFWGFVFSLIPHPTMLGSLVCYSAAVGLSIFTMVVTDTEHPPGVRNRSRGRHHGDVSECVDCRCPEHRPAFPDPPVLQALPAGSDVKSKCLSAEVRECLSEEKKGPGTRFENPPFIPL